MPTLEELGLSRDDTACFLCTNCQRGEKPLPPTPDEFNHCAVREGNVTRQAWDRICLGQEVDAELYETLVGHFGTIVLDRNRFRPQVSKWLNSDGKVVRLLGGFSLKLRGNPVLEPEKEADKRRVRYGGRTQYRLIKTIRPTSAQPSMVAAILAVPPGTRRINKRSIPSEDIPFLFALEKAGGVARCKANDQYRITPAFAHYLMPTGEEKLREEGRIDQKGNIVRDLERFEDQTASSPPASPIENIDEDEITATDQHDLRAVDEVLGDLAEEEEIPDLEEVEDSEDDD